MGGVMFRRCLISFSLIIAVCGSLITGCSSKDAKNKTPETTGTARPSIILGNQYVLPESEETFYCMRVKNEYYKFVFTGSSAEQLSADDPSLLPVLEDGQFARVTAVIEVTKSDFGFVPVITTVSTRIVKLKASEPVEFEDIMGVFNLPSADSKEINPESKLFQYTHEGKRYLILKYKDKVTAYTKAGLFTEYDVNKGEEPFQKFFNSLGATK